MDFKENVIEWYTGDNRVTVSLNQKRYRNRIKRMAEKYPKLVEIVAENADGTITARIPLKAVHLTIYGSNTGGFAEEEEEELYAEITEHDVSAPIIVSRNDQEGE